MHVCLRPVDRTRDEEVERLLGLGATMVDDLRRPDSGWAVLADPRATSLRAVDSRRRGRHLLQLTGDCNVTRMA